MDNRELAAKKKAYKFNITDVFLIAVIIIAGSVLVYIVAETGLLRGAEEVYIFYTIEIPIIGNEFIHAISRISPGDRITDAVRGNDMGEIQEVRISPAFSDTEHSITGVVRNVPFPDHSRIQIDVKARGRSEDPNYTVNGQIIMVGARKYFRTRYFTWYGTCIAMDPVYDER